MIKETGFERVFNILNIFFMITAALAVILPMLYLLANSFITMEEAARRQFIMIPEKFDLTAYKLILFGSPDIPNGYKITLFRVTVGTFLNMLFTCFLAYALSRKDLPFRDSITLYLFITMLFNGGLIPYYVVAIATGMRNNIWVYIIPGLVSAWNVLLLRNFMMEIPESIIESAEIDGANQVYILFKLIIPLSIPSLVTIALFYAVSHWNSWFDAYLFVTNTKRIPLQLILRNILVTTQVNLHELQGSQISEILRYSRPSDRAVQNAAVVVSTLPIVCVYPFLQKYFIKGIMMGSVKG